MCDHLLIHVDAHPRRPPAGRYPARHAHTCHAPSGSAAGASRRPHGQMLTRSASVSPSCSQLLTLGYGAGNDSRGLGCAGPGEPATDPHSGIRDSLPSLAPFGAAPSAQAAPPRQCPARFSGPMPSVHSPLRPSDSALCSQRVACLPNRLARIRRG